MATEAITTSVTVGFDIEADVSINNIFSAEVDGREVADGGQNPNGTSFKPGDTVAIMLFKSSNITIDQSLSSSGSLTSFGASAFSAVSEVDDFIVFESEPKQSLSYPVTGAATFTWLGGSLGATSVVDFGSSVELVTEPTAEYYVGVLHSVYNSNGIGIYLTNTLISEDKYEIFCFWAGTYTT